MVYYQRALHSYFIIACSRKIQWPTPSKDIRAVHDGKVGCNTVEYTKKAFLYSDWLYFQWLSIKHDMDIKICVFTRSFHSYPANFLADRTYTPTQETLL